MGGKKIQPIDCENSSMKVCALPSPSAVVLMGGRGRYFSAWVGHPGSDSG